MFLSFLKFKNYAISTCLGTIFVVIIPLLIFLFPSSIFSFAWLGAYNIVFAFMAKSHKFSEFLLAWKVFIILSLLKTSCTEYSENQQNGSWPTLSRNSEWSLVGTHSCSFITMFSGCFCVAAAESSNCKRSYIQQNITYFFCGLLLKMFANCCNIEVWFLKSV